MHKLSRRLAERSKTFLLRELIPQTLVKLLNFARGRLALPLQTGPFHVTADHFAHLDRIKGFVDVIVSAETERFLRGLERAEAGEHDYGEMRINFANLAQAVDAVHPGHANVHDNCIGMLFL